MTARMTDRPKLYVLSGLAPLQVLVDYDALLAQHADNVAMQACSVVIYFAIFVGGILPLFVYYCNERQSKQQYLFSVHGIGRRPPKVCSLSALLRSLSLTWILTSWAWLAIVPHGGVCALRHRCPERPPGGMQVR